MSEYDTLPEDTREVVDAVISECQRKKVQVSRAHKSGNVYAHPHPGGGISWGVNGGDYGFNIARGVKRPNSG